MASGAPKTRAELQRQRAKLVNSYNELLTEFSSPELTTVGNYSLGRLIGKGSFGKVYLGSHKLTNGSKVVLKSAFKHDANLAREIHHHRQLIHPHIARLYEVIVTETLVWLVLEWCPGDELYTYLVKNTRVSVEKTQKIFAQLVGAVAYVHTKNCVHRDLKLENILLDKHENVKLVDFGFTREYEVNKLLETFCGTVCYSAPEMLRGEKYVAYAVDVWSLGVILYALLVGELPFDEEDEQATRKKIQEEEPRYPDHLTEDAKDLIKAMLSKTPSQRPRFEDILSHPFLAEHGPYQKSLLALPTIPPFSTKIEVETLHRLKSAGVNIDAVIESVRAQKCDSLAGWWNILIEKEIRKDRRRRKRLESRRVSAASNLDPGLYPAPKEEMEDLERLRKREEERMRRMEEEGRNSLVMVPHLPPVDPPSPQSSPAPTVPRKDTPTTTAPGTFSPYLKPPYDPHRKALSTPDLPRRPTRKQIIIAQLTSIKHWFLDSAKRAVPAGATKSSHSAASTKSREKGETGSKNESAPSGGLYPVFRSEIKSSGRDSLKSSKSKLTKPHANGLSKSHPNQPTSDIAGWHTGFTLTSPPPTSKSALPSIPQINTSLSQRPGPSTPRQRYTRNPHRLSAGSDDGHRPRGRNSTSSSISSIRSFHKSHSKASSTSSASISSLVLKSPRSPRGSIKVLPPSAASSGASTPRRGYAAGRNKPLPLPTMSAGGSPNSSTGELALADPKSLKGLGLNFSQGLNPPPSPGLRGRYEDSLPPFGSAFARRKKSPFKGPSISSGLAISGGLGAGLGMKLGRRWKSKGDVNGGLPTNGGSAIVEEEEEPDEEEGVLVVREEEAVGASDEGEWVEERPSIDEIPGPLVVNRTRA